MVRCMAKITKMKEEFGELLTKMAKEHRNHRPMRSLNCSLPDENIPIEFFIKINMLFVVGGLLGLSKTEHTLLTKYKKQFTVWLKLQQ